MIEYEGADSENPYAFKYYNPDEFVGGKTMKEHLRFAVAYWHTFDADGKDPFGDGTMFRAWNRLTHPLDKAKARAEAAFEFLKSSACPISVFMMLILSMKEQHCVKLSRIWIKCRLFSKK